MQRPWDADPAALKGSADGGEAVDPAAVRAIEMELARLDPSIVPPPGVGTAMVEHLMESEAWCRFLMEKLYPGMAIGPYHTLKYLVESTGAGFLPSKMPFSIVIELGMSIVTGGLGTLVGPVMSTGNNWFEIMMIGGLSIMWAILFSLKFEEIAIRELGLNSHSEEGSKRLYTISVKIPFFASLASGAAFLASLGFGGAALASGAVVGGFLIPPHLRDMMGRYEQGRRNRDFLKTALDETRAAGSGHDPFVQSFFDMNPAEYKRYLNGSFREMLAREKEEAAARKRHLQTQLAEVDALMADPSFVESLPVGALARMQTRSADLKAAIGALDDDLIRPLEAAIDSVPTLAERINGIVAKEENLATYERVMDGDEDIRQTVEAEIAEARARLTAEIRSIGEHIAHHHYHLDAQVESLQLGTSPTP